MNEITVVREVYQGLLKDRYFAEAMRSLLKSKLKSGNSIYADEIKTICSLLGIEADDE